MPEDRYFANIKDRNSVITAIDTSVRFPEVLGLLYDKYHQDIDLFCRMVAEADSSAALLDSIRSPGIQKDRRMSLLKMFRRCVSPVPDTETTKKMKIPTSSLVENYGSTFKPIDLLKDQFRNPSREMKSALAVLIGEYDTRGQLGYMLTGRFFEWFRAHFDGRMTIEGPHGAGRDIELRTIFPEFKTQYPCDFVIKKHGTGEVLAIGFARYDSTRGGAQSDDRTGGNAYKVMKAREYCEESGDQIRLLFISDGPGLTHGDTWYEASELDGDWDGNVRVSTLKTAEDRVTADWLLRVASD